MIAQWQIEQFHQQGFLVVEEVLSAEEVALLQATPRLIREWRRLPVS